MACHGSRKPMLCESVGFLFMSQLFALVLVISAIQEPLHARDKSPFNTNFDDLASGLLDHWHTPGIAIAVIDGNRSFCKGYGFESLPDISVTPLTLFYTASTTKSFTAAAVSLLVDDTANSSTPLTWQTPLVDHLHEDFVMKDEYMTTHVTLEDAVSHRTGQPGYDLPWAVTNDSLRDVVRKFRHLSPTAEIRTRWQYCNMIFIAISYLVEKVTGLWLGEFLRARIYEPLNMTTTFFALSDARAAVAAGRVSLAQGYAWNNLTRSYMSLPYMDKPVVSGAGATISTVLDYVKWLRCLMTMSLPLSTAGHTAIRQPRITRPPNTEGTGFADYDFYALGLQVSFYRGELMIWHMGGLPGFGTIMAFLPGKQWGVVSMANTVEGGSVVNEILAFGLLDDMLRIPASERYDWGKRAEEVLANASFVLNHAREIVYPEAPKSPVPHALPLQDYAGLYRHAAYPSLNLTLNEAYADAESDLNSTAMPYLQTRSYHDYDSIYVSLEHVSGEYFLAHMRRHMDETPQRGNYDPWMDKVVKAEFRLGVDGRVKEMGIEIEPQLGEIKIWWQKQA